MPRPRAALGRIEDRNVRVDYRWAAGKTDLFHRHAVEIAALAPDVILAAGTGLPPVLQGTRTIPVVFVHVADPVGNNYVASLSRPAATPLASCVSNTILLRNGLNSSRRSRRT